MLHHTDPTFKNYISKSLFSPTHTDLTPFKVDKQHKNTNDATCLFLRSLLVLKNAILLGSKSWYRKKRGTKTNKQQQQQQTLNKTNTKTQD